MDNSMQYPSNNDVKTRSVKSLDGQGLKRLLNAGIAWLKANQQTVNSLNVFPVPDGDTGTNMVLTMQAAQNEIAASEEKNIGRMAQAIAQGALMGARGNSGVILSQLWRGFARALDHFDTMDANLLTSALTEAKNTAYKGVVRPVEGTILTVAKDISIEAEHLVTQSDELCTLLEKIIDAADQSVKRTPELLPILKQAGVVDSGGKGLFYIFEGMYRYINNLPLDTPETTVLPIADLDKIDEHEGIEPGQDYEVIVDFQPNGNLELENFYEGLSEIGTSIQVGEGNDMYRMHIHVPTNNRYAPIDYIMNLGTISKVYIENLMTQTASKNKTKKVEFNLAKVEEGQIAVVAVSPGDGLSNIFASLGVAALVSGGQTMNPSTEEILKSFENFPTDNIIVLPNNKNILLAAQTAAEMTDKNLAVIPSVNIPQGLSAMLRLDPDGDFDEIVEEMNEAIFELEAGEITIANRNVEINGVDVKEGSVIALLNGKLVFSGETLEEACLGLLSRVDVDERERFTFFYGNDLTEEEVETIIAKVQEKYPSHEIEIHEGGQPHYHFIISIE